MNTNQNFTVAFATICSHVWKSFDIGKAAPNPNLSLKCITLLSECVLHVTPNKFVHSFPSFTVSKSLRHFLLPISLSFLPSLCLYSFTQPLASVNTSLSSHLPYSCTFHQTLNYFHPGFLFPLPNLRQQSSYDFISALGTIVSLHSSAFPKTYPCRLCARSWAQQGTTSRTFPSFLVQGQSKAA